MIKDFVFQDKLNGIYLYEQFGLIVQTGFQNMLAFPDRKEVLSNNWREENGSDYDLENVVFEDKEVTLNCAFIADDPAEYWANNTAFFAELTKPGWQKLFVDDHDHEYDVFYKKTANWSMNLKRLKNVEKVFVKFQLTIQVR